MCGIANPLYCIASQFYTEQIRVKKLLMMLLIHSGAEHWLNILLRILCFITDLYIKNITCVRTDRAYTCCSEHRPFVVFRSGTSTVQCTVQALSRVPFWYQYCSVYCSGRVTCPILAPVLFSVLFRPCLVFHSGTSTVQCTVQAVSRVLFWHRYCSVYCSGRITYPILAPVLFSVLFRPCHVSYSVTGTVECTVQAVSRVLFGTSTVQCTVQAESRVLFWHQYCSVYCACPVPSLPWYCSVNRQCSLPEPVLFSKQAMFLACTGTVQ